MLRPPVSKQGQRGISLVELMVGLTVGLIVSAGASIIAVNQINEHRRLMLETQIQQDLRTAADLIQQDIRRAGFRGTASLGVWAPATGVGTPSEAAPLLASANPYQAILVSDSSEQRVIEYAYAKNLDRYGVYIATSAPQNNEYFGIKLNKSNKTLYLKLGKRDGQDNWQPLTDPETLSITNLTIDTGASQSVYLTDFCDKPCDTTDPAANCPQQQIREIKFSITGQAVHDSKVLRTLSGVERVRADAISGVCPA